jgi:hypothetical protein
LFELANLRADRGLRAEHFLARSREALEFGDENKSSKLVEVHIQILGGNYIEFCVPPAELLSFLFQK